MAAAWGAWTPSSWNTESTPAKPSDPVKLPVQQLPHVCVCEQACPQDLHLVAMSLPREGLHTAGSLRQPLRPSSRILSRASEALEMSSRRKMSLLEYSELMMMSISLFTSAWN